MDFFGREFYPFDPKPTDIRIEEIAMMLARTHRYTNQSSLTVAQHSILVKDLVAGEDAHPATLMWALLHDAHEAYIGDFSRALCREADMRFVVHGETWPIEKLKSHIDMAIFEAVFPPAQHIVPVERITHYDRVATCWEARDVLKTPLNWWRCMEAEVPDRNIMPWDSEMAEREFMAEYTRLTKAIRLTP